MKQELSPELKLQRQKKKLFSFGIGIELLIPVMIIALLITKESSNVLFTGVAIFLLCVFFVLGTSLIARGIILEARAGM
jgi:hypothetical protein